MKSWWNKTRIFIDNNNDYLNIEIFWMMQNKIEINHFEVLSFHGSEMIKIIKLIVERGM